MKPWTRQRHHRRETAYYLGRSGHEVVVVDRQTAAGMETSFANAGHLRVLFALGWTRRAVKAARWLLMSTVPSCSGCALIRTSQYGWPRCWRTATSKHTG